MKLRIYSLIFLSFFIFSSCDEWLDVKPQNKVTEDELFNSPDGFRSVLNGLYKQMSTESLYGVQLQFGFIDILSRQYDINQENCGYPVFRAIYDYDLENEQVVRTIDGVYKKAYNIIANTNNLIQNLETKSESFFEDGEMEKKMILGEAYGLRALLHFDMLRIFAPAKIQNDGGAYIPYVSKYPDRLPVKISSDKVLELVISDLEKGRELVAAFDTTNIGIQVVCTSDSRFYNDYPYDSDIAYNKGNSLSFFYKGRGYRLNYDAMTALLARVYQYADRHEDALECAEYIIDKKHEWNSYDGEYVYSFTSEGITTGNFERKDNLKRNQSLIFAIHNEKAFDNLGLEYYFEKEIPYGRSPYYLTINLGQNIFTNSDNIDESDTDYRSKYLIFYGGERFPISAKWYCSEDEDLRDKNVTILPMIGLAEMYYIAAESYARNNNFGKATILIEKVRAENGCSMGISISDMDDFKKELINDARREYISEGQLFYLYKRLDYPVDFGNNEIRPFKRSEAIMPLPNSESL